LEWLWRDRSGFPKRYLSLGITAVRSCLRWLANFHATFMGVEQKGLWEIGSYWNLATRPDEYASMAEGELKQAATELDRLLNNCVFKTLIHGDAKAENFCFSNNGKSVAAVDFQYVGGGCGIKDVAYFLGSCLDENQCNQWQDEMLDFYFAELKNALDKKQKQKQLDWGALEKEWRTMFPIAWTDFYRFVAGWMPMHKKINKYTRRLAEETFAVIKS